MNKYLAGCLDADGTITLGWTETTAGYKPRLIVKLYGWRGLKHTQELFDELITHYGFGSLSHQKSNDMLAWTCSGSQAMSLLGRVKKHLVIKGAHADRMIEYYQRYRSYGNARKTKDTDFVRRSRNRASPIKPKQRVSKAWLAGYIDFEAHIYRREVEEIQTLADGTRKLYTRTRCGLEWGIHKKDRVALDLIAATYGGQVLEGRTNEIKLRYNFGKRTKLRARKILKPLIPHMVIRRWHAEQILAYLNSLEPAETK